MFLFCSFFILALGVCSCPYSLHSVYLGIDLKWGSGILVGAQDPKQAKTLSTSENFLFLSLY